MIRAMGPCWLLCLLAACDFDAAFTRYCDNNPNCPTADAAGAADTAQPRDAADAPPLLPIPPPRNCGPFNPCSNPNEFCHPFGLVCMTTCMTAADCPPWLDTCVEIRDPSGTVWSPKVCTCNSVSVCSDYQDGFTCNLVDSLCERLCRSTSDCYLFAPPRVCDQFQGTCLLSSAPCHSNPDCPSPFLPRCDPYSLRCTGCVSFYDCVGRPDGNTQCSATGACTTP
jgi:hypothetical protein